MDLPRGRLIDLELAEADAAAVKQSAGQLQAAYQATACQLVRMRSAAVFPNRFNDLLEEHGNKSTLLSRVTLELVGRAMGGLSLEPTLVLCDKHGGRNKYGRLLQQAADRSGNNGHRKPADELAELRLLKMAEQLADRSELENRLREFSRMLQQFGDRQRRRGLLTGDEFADELNALVRSLLVRLPS